MTFSPTAASDLRNICHLCGQQDGGIGLGAASRNDQDPRWLCPDCIDVGEPLYTAGKNRRAMTRYESMAVERAIGSLTPFLEQHGTDLAEWDDAVAEEFVVTVWQACGDELRDAIREGAS